MGFLDKVKGFFYDEEEIEETVEVPVKREQPKKKPIKYEEEKEIPERELFRSERTFNFPMDMGDEEPDFTPVKRQVKEEKKRETTEIIQKPQYKLEKEEKKYYKPYSAVKVENKEEKKFRPTPIISPIYGIVEGELPNSKPKKESLLSETREFSITKRINFDEVREKAYGSSKQVIEKEDDEETEENKSIFFNLVDDTKEESNDIFEKNDDAEEDDIKITYNDVDYDNEDEYKEDTDEEIEIPMITRSKKSQNKIEETEEDEKILSETKEQDLFNLIDNMYNSEEEEEE